MNIQRRKLHRQEGEYLLGMLSHTTWWSPKCIMALKTTLNIKAMRLMFSFD